MNGKDSVGDHLKSDERKERKKEILAKASDVVNRNKLSEHRKRTSEEIQRLIDTYRNQLHDENMQPPPPPEFVDEFGKTIFEDKSEISFGGSMMPQRFKGSRAGEPRDSLSNARQSNLNMQKIEAMEGIRQFDSAPSHPVKPAYQPSAPPTPREMYEMRSTQPPPEDSTSPPQYIQDQLTAIKDFQSTARSASPQPTMQEQYDANKEFSHTTDLVFHDLTTEEYREYMYNNGGVLRILHPWKLAISKSNNHRVATLDGFSYIIVPNWIAIRIKIKVDAPAFSF